MSRELAATRATPNLASVAAQHVHDVFEAKVAIMLGSAAGSLENVATGDKSFSPDEKDRGVVEWVFSHGKVAGLGTDTLPSARASTCLFARRGRGRRPRRVAAARGRFDESEQRALLDVFAVFLQIASALERAQPGRADAARAAPDRDRAPPKFAPQLRLARSPDAARGDHRVGERLL